MNALKEIVRFVYLKGIAKMLNKELLKYVEYEKIDFFVTRASNQYVKHMLEEEFQFNVHPVYPNILVKML